MGVSAEMESETGNDFVENQDGAMLGCEAPQAGKEAWLWVDEPHIAGNGFDNNGGDFVAHSREECFGCGKVVVGEHPGLCRNCFGHAGRGGFTCGQEARSSGDEH